MKALTHADLPSAPHRRLTDKEIATKIQDALRDGFCVLRNHFPRETLLTWQQAFWPLLERQIAIEGETTSRGAHRYYVTLPFAQPFADPIVFMDEDLLAIVEKLVGADPVFVQLATDTPLLGSDYQDTHRDTLPLFPEAGFETPPFQLAVNFPLVDVTPENGPFEVARRTHMVSKDQGMRMIASGETPLEPIYMQLGDVMIRDVRGLHRGTPNRTNMPRPMVVLGYSRKWYYRPEVSIQVPREALKNLPERARRLLRFNPVVEKLERTAQAESYNVFSY